MPSLPPYPLPRRIGLMANLIGATSLESMIGAAVDHLEAQGFDTLVISSGKSVEDEVRAWETLARSHCDGFIAHSDALSNDRLSRLISTRKNVVLANLDNKLAGQLAAKHLLQMGHRHIAMVTGSEDRHSKRQLNEGFSHQIKQNRSAKIKFQILEAPTDNIDGGAQAMSELLNNGACPTAIFFHCDLMAIGAMTKCQEHSRRIPEDISILGYGDLNEARDAASALSTICQPLAAIGQSAAARMIRIFDSSAERLLNQNHQDSLQPLLVLRKSTNDRRKISLLNEETNTPISNRERECLQWASQGKTSWEISQILGVSESTVIYHLRNATRKLNAANRLQAVTKALKASIIEF